VQFHRYVALGDSFTEGVGDADATLPNGVRGWADRMAEVLAARDDNFTYANLAIRGRKLLPILDEQIEPALAMKPDLVSIYAGANDVLRPRIDLDMLVDEYDKALSRLSGAGAHLVLFTAYDPGRVPVFAALRGRFAIYNELVRHVADTHGATLVDFWRMRAYRDPRLWDTDRMHMSSAGHQVMAIEVLNALGIEHDLKPLELGERKRPSLVEQSTGHAHWLRASAGPWVKRRLTGTSSGDHLEPRWPELVRLDASPVLDH
jgi:lysophospholipase L1-like esterase